MVFMSASLHLVFSLLLAQRLRRLGLRHWEFRASQDLLRALQFVFASPSSKDEATSGSRAQLAGYCLTNEDPTPSNKVAPDWRRRCVVSGQGGRPGAVALDACPDVRRKRVSGCCAGQARCGPVPEVASLTLAKTKDSPAGDAPVDHSEDQAARLYVPQPLTLGAHLAPLFATWPDG